jgi:osomolarity two-component system phosphorelay intermediate protein YPD1
LATESTSNQNFLSEGHQLDTLSQLGHYLKGSSATLGLNRVKDHCEKIQHLGAGKTETGENTRWDEEALLKKIRDILPQLKSDCADVEKRLQSFYEHFPSS